MISKLLGFVTSELNKEISVPGQPATVVLCSIVNEKGELNIQNGQLAVTLVNIEEERFLKVQVQREKRSADQIQFANPEIKLNLLLMLAVNPGSANPGTDNYLAAMDIFSKAITFFQGTSFFEKKQYPQLAPDIEQFSIELLSLSLEQQNQLWASLGAKYLPSVIYKVRLLFIDKSLFGDNKTVIKAIDNELKKIN
jgi:hypothetical protein